MVGSIKFYIYYRFSSEDGRQNQILYILPIFIWGWSAKSNFTYYDFHLRMVSKITFFILTMCMWGWWAKPIFLTYWFASENNWQNQILHPTDLHLRMVGKIKFYILPICISGWSGESNFISYRFASEDGREIQILYLTNLPPRMAGLRNQISYLTDLHLRIRQNIIFYILGLKLKTNLILLVL